MVKKLIQQVVNHVYTHSLKLFSIIKFGSGSIFCVFPSVASILIGNYDEYNLFYLFFTHTKIFNFVKEPSCLAQLNFVLITKTRKQAIALIVTNLS